MAIAFDAFTLSSQNVETFSHTCSGDSRLLTVGATYDDRFDSITSITYGGQALTKIVRKAHSSIYLATELWYIGNPLSGSNEVVITYDYTTNVERRHFALSLTGVDQTSPVDAYNSGEGNSATPSVTISTVADGAWLVDCQFNDYSSTQTPDIDQVERVDVLFVEFGERMLASNKGPVSSGSNSMGWSI